MKSTIPPFIAVGFVLFGIISLVFYLRDRKIKNELREHGVTVTARVTSRNHEVQRRTDNNHMTTTTDSYYVSYQYDVNGMTYSGRDSVSHDVYDAVLEGQPIEVVYLRENPAEARLASSL